MFTQCKALTAKLDVRLKAYAAHSAYPIKDYADNKGIDTHAYIFINLDTTKAYTLLFSRFFAAIADVTRQPIRFAYLHHGQGIRTITVDMCNKQAAGMHPVNI